MCQTHVVVSRQVDKSLRYPLCAENNSPNVGSDAI
jgi:hypothetical protein